MALRERMRNLLTASPDQISSHDVKLHERRKRYNLRRYGYGEIRIGLVIPHLAKAARVLISSRQSDLVASGYLAGTLSRSPA